MAIGIGKETGHGVCVTLCKSVAMNSTPVPDLIGSREVAMTFAQINSAL